MPIDDFESVITDLRGIPRETRKSLSPVLKEEGEWAALDARARAGWSTRIPGAIRVAVRYGARPGVRLVVSAARAPHARAFENLGRPGVFRHPLFGDEERWFAQAARPYAWPAIVARGRDVERSINDVVLTAARRRGFH